jgi:hypothetical protein
VSGHQPSRRERRRRERELERAAKQLDRLDARYGVGTQPGATPEPDPPRRRTVPAGLAGLLVTGLLLTGVVLVTPGDGFDTVRRLFGISSGRLGDVPDYEPGTGTYKFMYTQRGSDEPVGYDPCRPIEYGVNPDAAPDDWETLIETAVARTETATGLRFEYVGTTDERPFDPTSLEPLSVTRRPVVIGFADEDELKELADAVAGLGGSVGVRGSLGRDYLVTGSIALDTDVFQDGWFGGARQDLQAIVDHEFGHLVGLGHVKDPGELMARRNTGQITYGPGDLEGLALLGSIPCA